MALVGEEPAVGPKLSEPGRDGRSGVGRADGGDERPLYFTGSLHVGELGVEPVGEALPFEDAEEKAERLELVSVPPDDDPALPFTPAQEAFQEELLAKDLSVVCPVALPGDEEPVVVRAYRKHVVTSACQRQP